MRKQSRGALQRSFREPETGLESPKPTPGPSGSIWFKLPVCPFLRTDPENAPKCLFPYTSGLPTIRPEPEIYPYETLLCRRINVVRIQSLPDSYQ
jgi:hypothetical protein